MKILRELLREYQTLKMVPLFWLNQKHFKQMIDFGLTLIPIAGYKPCLKYRAYKIILPLNFDTNEYISKIPTNFPFIFLNDDDIIDVDENFQLTASYAHKIELNFEDDDSENNAALQMFWHMSDKEKKLASKYDWSNPRITEYIRDWCIDNL